MESDHENDGDVEDEHRPEEPVILVAVISANEDNGDKPDRPDSKKLSKKAGHKGTIKTLSKANASSRQETSTGRMMSDVSLTYGNEGSMPTGSSASLSVSLAEKREERNRRKREAKKNKLKEEKDGQPDTNANIASSSGQHAPSSPMASPPVTAMPSPAMSVTQLPTVASANTQTNPAIGPPTGLSSTGQIPTQGSTGQAAPTQMTQIASNSNPSGSGHSTAAINQGSTSQSQAIQTTQTPAASVKSVKTKKGKKKRRSRSYSSSSSSGSYNSSDSSSSYSSSESSSSSGSSSSSRSRSRSKRSKRHKKKRKHRKNKNVKMSLPDPYDGTPDMDWFDEWAFDLINYMDVMNIEDSVMVKMMARLLTKKGKQFYLSYVAKDPRRWTVAKMIPRIFNYCFPSDVLEQLRRKWDRLVQGKKQVRDYAREIENLARKFKEMNERQVVLKFWNGLNHNIRGDMRLFSYDPERASLSSTIRWAIKCEKSQNERSRILKEDRVRQPEGETHKPKREWTRFKNRNGGTKHYKPEDPDRAQNNPGKV